MLRSSKLKSTFFLSVLFLTSTTSYCNQPDFSRVKFSSWYIYWDSKKVSSAVDQYASSLERLCAFGLSFDKNGNLISTFDSLPETAQFLRQKAPQAKILLTAVNDIMGGRLSKLKDPGIVHQVLSDPIRMDTHIKQLLSFAKPFDGIEIDYENLNVRDRDHFSEFIRKLAKEVHQQNKLLSVIIEPKTDEMFRKGSVAIDNRVIGESADIVTLMAYYLHFPNGIPGPVAPTSWVKQVTSTVLTQVPKEKLTVALVMNGVDWSDQDKGKTIDYETAMAIANAKNQKVKRDRKSGSPTFRYKEGSARHMVWFEDDASLCEKIAALEKMGITQIGLWRLGSGDPTFWRRPNPKGTGS